MKLLHTDRMGAAVIAASLLTSLSLLPLTQEASYLGLAAIGIVLVGAIGILGRRFDVDNSLILVGQFILAVVFLMSVAGSLMSEGDLWWRPIELYADAILTLQTESAPLPPNAGVKLLLVTAVVVVAIMTDLLAIGIDRPAWSVAPLLTIYLIPALGVYTDVPWWSFAAVAIGYLVILAMEAVQRTELWQRTLARDSAERGSVVPLAARLGLVVAVPAIALSLVMGMIIPAISPLMWGGSRPTGDQPIQLTDPSLDLRRNLNQPDDVPVLRYTTDQPGGVYLRMASLPAFDARGWQNVGIQLRSGNVLPSIPGMTNPPQEIRRTQITIDDFASMYLPAPYAPRTVDAPGSWSHDPQSLVVINTDEDNETATRGLSYEVTSADIIPNGEQLSVAVAGSPADRQYTTAIPDDLPQEIIDLTLDITREAPTPALRAAAIQKYLREGGGFTYSTDPQPGSGYDALMNFLFVDKIGYCEQFSAAMALMARIVDIPTRVAVGFLPGDLQADGSYVVTTHNMHAWPELYFEGIGWVRFEPTPSVATAPVWTTVNEEVPQPSSDPSGGSDVPSEAPPEPSVEPTEQPSENPDLPPVVNDEGEGTLLALLVDIARVVVTLVVVAAILAIPGLVRRRLRHRRLHATDAPPRSQVLYAWREVRDTVRDVRQPWPSGTPRRIGSELSGRLPGAAAGAMHDLALAAERSRYAPKVGDVGDLAEQVRLVREGLLSDKNRWQRWLIALFPYSLWHNGRLSLRRLRRKLLPGSRQ
ncbi:transglutaminase family protein [Parenemella sanctibonifatiensis]|uniref:Transglutaminase-like domain-containing protein n=1 Tax=Parenemella sanctibonifatiensis TaxID=2016505 RepID=A0A255EK48_9ACTN|nr:DUF3488 and transglutaminase-like domain-containing protein [Parenemella sanctibonifatiensis]OYN89822.1 hypothetical protein CGZ91_09940 [Parenemella sanctibonifatiensis]